MSTPIVQIFVMYTKNDKIFVLTQDFSGATVLSSYCSDTYKDQYDNMTFETVPTKIILSVYFKRSIFII